jgi:predicted nucleic acid-binding Zn ribbon protein
MPIFEFKCPKCGSVLETVQAVSAPEPTCNGGALKGGDHEEVMMQKQLSVPARPIFHGTGFYETDYRRKPPKP